MKHNWMWFYRGVNDDNMQLLLNFKKHLLIRELKKETIHQYLKEISNWMKYLQDKNIETFEASVEDLEEYLNKMDVSNARILRVLSVLNVFYKHNKKKKYCKRNIVEEFRNK